MTRLERRRRRQWRAVYLILAAAVITLAGVIVWAQPFKVEPLERTPSEPPYEMFATAAHTAVDYPVRSHLRDDIPMDEETQTILYNACREWDVPYELALAVCWRETGYEHKVTVIEHGDGTVRHYYGMMAVQLESAGQYMERCGVEDLQSVENSLRVGCCILSSHRERYGNDFDALCRYCVEYEGWYAAGVLAYMEDLMG